MKKKNLLIVILILIISFYKINVEAASCTADEKKALKEEARTLEIIPVLENEKNEWHEYFYGISIVNWNENFYIVDTNNTKYYKPDDYHADSLYGQYSPGTAETFKVYARYGTNCAFEHLVTIRVTFEHYNHYYMSPLCEGIEEFNLCKRTYSGKIESDAWFEEQVKNYKASLEDKGEDKEKLTILEEMQKYIKENPVVIVIGVVITILIVVIVIGNVRSSKKRIKVNLDLK